MRPHIVLALCLAALLTAESRAMFMAPEGTPVDRLVANITKYVQEHPDDANARYLLGRVHALALLHNRDVVGTFPAREGQAGKLPEVAEDFMQGWVRPAGAGPARGPAQGAPQPQPLTDEQKAAHLAAALDNYLKALEMDPKPAHYHLGLAYVLDKGRPLVGRVAPPKLADDEAYKTALLAWETATKPGDDDKSAALTALKDYWREAAIRKYLDAYNLAKAKDAQIQHQPIQGINSLVSYEAGTNYLALLKERESTASEKQTAAAVEKHLLVIKNKPMGPITPIVFSLTDARPLAALLAPRHTVRFDLDGDGHAEPRPWVAPDTAILCWDPAGNGRITSGKQLFGSVTFHLYPGDGYTAMNLLDDNRDGKLAGDELPGLALWFDRNSDGISDPGEVVPIAKTPIAAISIRAVSETDGAPMNPFGLRLRDGRVLPTYDWIAPAVSASGD